MFNDRVHLINQRTFIDSVKPNDVIETLTIDDIDTIIKSLEYTTTNDVSTINKMLYIKRQLAHNKLI